MSVCVSFLHKNKLRAYMFKKPPILTTRGGFLVMLVLLLYRKDKYMDIEVKDIIEVSKVALPVITTIVTHFYARRASARHSAKQSVLQMIMEDQFGWEIFRKFPVNYGNILNEYEVYHKNGGNGEVTKKVDEYKEWYKKNENEMINTKEIKCTPNIALACNNKIARGARRN